LKTSDGRRVRLHFAKHPPTNLLTGDHVSVHGSQSGVSMMLASGGIVTNFAKTQPPPPAGPLPNTFGAQSTLVILVNFQDAPTNQPYTLAAAQNVVFGTVSNFFLENSYQQTWLTGDVVGWYTIPLSSTTCSTSSIRTTPAASAGRQISAEAHRRAGSMAPMAAAVWTFTFSTTSWDMLLAFGIPICSIAAPAPPSARLAPLLSTATSWTQWERRKPHRPTTTPFRRSGWAGLTMGRRLR
jgi:hypothetical protein